MPLKLEQDLIKYINKHSGTSLHKSGTRLTDFLEVHKDLHYYQQSPASLLYPHIQIKNLKSGLSQSFHTLISLSDLIVDTESFLMQSFKRLCLYPSEAWRGIAATLQPQFICSGTENQPCSVLRALCVTMAVPGQNLHLLFSSRHPIGMVLPAVSAQQLSCTFKTQQLSLPWF